MQYVWAATAAAVISVGATAAGTAMSYSASQKAGKAQAAASKKATRQERKALGEQEKAAKKYEREMGKVKAPVYDIGAMAGDAERISQYNRAQLEKFLPGAAAQRERAVQQVDDAMAKVSEYMGGKVPKDVQDQIIRNVAEQAGAGFNLPGTAGAIGPSGFQAAQGLAARQLGLTSLQLSQFGIEAMPRVQNVSQSWNQIAKQFIAEPLDVGKLQFAYGQAATDLAMQQATNRYNARSGLLGEQRQLSGREYERSLQQAETNLALDQARASMIQDTASSLSSGVSAAGSAYSKYAQAKGSPITGYGGQQFVKKTSAAGGEFYAPQSGSLF
jgi:hypothetical protein